ncbi:MAG: CNNM domain-containing protein [Halobacteriota archaeon]|uniref:CNNM domain-containing protein n=1 Tax=Natronomonas sp. TaxID=2184060 RepID=UPI00397597F3
MAFELGVTTVGGLAILCSIVASAFLSSSELAFFSLARHRIDALAVEGTPGGRALATLRSGRDRSGLVDSARRD